MLVNKMQQYKKVLKRFIRLKFWWLYAKPVNDTFLYDINQAVAKKIGMKPFKVIKVAEASFYNAMVFSFSCKSITITSFLKEAGRDAIEGVFLHEYAHCKLKHGQKLFCLALLLLILSMLPVTYLLLNSTSMIEAVFASITLALVYIFVQLILRRKARRFEYEADLFAALHATNSCAYIDLLCSFLRHKPFKNKINKITEIFSSHPSPHSRIENIVRHFPEMLKCMENTCRGGPGGI
jgi:Zn-dependent protease with chaperone function